MGRCIIRAIQSNMPVMQEMLCQHGGNFVWGWRAAGSIPPPPLPPCNTTYQVDMVRKLEAVVDLHHVVELHVIIEPLELRLASHA
jgi:hypothetical protein